MSELRMQKSEDLVNLTVKELLEIAKEYGIKGRHDMRKCELIEAIANIQVETTMSKKSKTEYINNVRVGDLLAFKVNETKILSGKVEQIAKDMLVVETKNGIRFNVRKKNIVWVKTGDRWPKGIYEALKGGTYVQDKQSC
jgi:transcription termination factor Rho